MNNKNNKFMFIDEKNEYKRGTAFMSKELS